MRILSQKGKCVQTGGGVYQYNADNKDFAVKIYKLKGDEEFYEEDIKNI